MYSSVCVEEQRRSSNTIARDNDVALYSVKLVMSQFHDVDSYIMHALLWCMQ